MSDDEWSALKRREVLYLLETLTGVDASTGVPPVALQITERFSSNVKHVQSALYDTLVLAFYRGYENDESFAVCSFDVESHRIASMLVKLAIIVMGEYVA